MASLFLRDAMTVEEFLTAACQKKGLNPVENFVRVKKRREMSSAKYFVPHRSDLIETYVSHFGGFETVIKRKTMASLFATFYCS
jgi:hypothetical protein